MQTVADRPEAPTAIRTDLGAIFVLVGTQSIDMADHFAVARRRREDVEASGAWWRCGRTTGALCGRQVASYAGLARILSASGLRINENRCAATIHRQFAERPDADRV